MYVHVWIWPLALGYCMPKERIVAATDGLTQLVTFRTELRQDDYTRHPHPATKEQSTPNNRLDRHKHSCTDGPLADDGLRDG